MIDKKRAKFLFAIFSSILLLDVISKWLTQNFLPLIQRRVLPYPFGGIGIFEDFIGINFSINHQINTGAAWGLFPDSHQLLFYIRISIIILLSIYLLLFNKNLRTQIPFAFIIAGAMGNILDSVFYGHVIDFFFLQFWGYDFPVFNVADSFIFLGVAWLCILNLKGEKKSSSPPSVSNDSKPFDSPPFT